MTHVTCRLTTKNRDQLWNPMLGIEYGLTFLYNTMDVMQSLAGVRLQQLLTLIYW